MGVGHWIGKKLGISRDLTKAEIKEMLQTIRTSVASIEEMYKKRGKEWGDHYIQVKRELELLMSTISKQDRIKLKSLQDLWYKNLIKYVYEDASLRQVIDFKALPSIKEEIDRLLREDFSI